jgi:hexosaminidase
LPFPFFNVCCDETDGLGTGPSKPIADKIGPGALYVQHLNRVHDLIVTNYHKRMMMWGDIILRHPDHLSEIPKDTVMLTWGYDPRPNFDDQILPFSKAGYEFWICPGVNCWNRILPQFGTATTNIHNFVRDGIKRGATGMLNTAWDDDGETFNAPNWHGFAWGAECAWNASATCASDFNRRLGAVLFGEKADGFGQAIEQLSTPGIEGMPNSEFWSFKFQPIKISSVQPAREQWQKSLQPIRAAIASLETCRRQASTNSDLLEYFLFGARKMELRFQRELDRLQAALAYRNAQRGPWAEALVWIERAEATLRTSRDAHEALSARFAELWQGENKPYALDWTMKRYQNLIGKFDAEMDRLHRLRTTAKSDRALPPAREMGLEIIETDRETRTTSSAVPGIPAQQAVPPSLR